MTIVDDIIFSVPKNQKYTLADIHDELQMVYGMGIILIQDQPVQHSQKQKLVIQLFDQIIL